MTTKNKILFAILVIALVLMAIAVIGATRIGLPADISFILIDVASILISISCIAWIGFVRMLKYIYISLVVSVVIASLLVLIFSDNILVWIGAVVFAVLAVASLIPVVFKSR